MQQYCFNWAYSILPPATMNVLLPLLKKARRYQARAYADKADAKIEPG
jgi:hypothetical protein